MKKTKIVATIGPSSKDEATLKEMILSGMDIARINMKYATYKFAESIIKTIKKLNDDLDTNVAIMLDLKGPDLTVGKFEGGTAYLTKGTKIRIYNDEIIGNSTKFSVNVKDFVKKIKVNTSIKLADGMIELLVIDKEDDYLLCNVVVGGFIEDNKGINIKNNNLNIPFLSEKDIEDIKFGSKMNVDYLALSFVKSFEDVLSVNDLLIELNNSHIAIISKIETTDAIDDIDEIIENSDGVMVARGDLGVEIPIERVPGIQKQVISKCHRFGKVSLVSAEMLLSMENNSRPTRAEVSDVANAVLDGVDCVILSGETTIGKYPVVTIDTMSKIIESTELDLNYYEFMDKTMRTEKQDISGNIAYSTIECADRLKCKFIVVPTMSGYTAKKISRFRPKCPIIALSPDKDVVKELSMYYGIYAVHIGDVKTFDKMMKVVHDTAVNLGSTTGDKVIITGGYPFREVKHTNFMKIEEI
ncbi:MAG: pyruvate kinase [Bacilli bacterium]|nr:pyruvate kinase [Bacilli bacterium]